VRFGHRSAALRYRAQSSPNKQEIALLFGGTKQGQNLTGAVIKQIVAMQIAATSSRSMML
jgi:hypothetical protein